MKLESEIFGKQTTLCLAKKQLEIKLDYTTDFQTVYCLLLRTSSLVQTAKHLYTATASS